MIKTMIGALALAMAVPAVAQTPPAGAQDPHAHHQGMDHAKHQQGQHDCKECCAKMKGKDGKMDCMDKKGETKPAAPQSGGQAGHDH